MSSIVKRKKIKSGMSTIETLIALTILIVLMAGINAILVTRAKLNAYHHDVLTATNLAQLSLENIRNQANDINYYLSLDNTVENNLNNPPFSLTAIESSVKEKFIGVLKVQSGEARTTKDLTHGNKIVVFIDKPPSQIGIIDGSSVTIYSIIDKITETVFIKDINDPSKHFNVDDTSPENGRTGLVNNYPKGSVVIGGSKALKIEIFYADPKNKNIIDKNRNKPLSYVTSIVSFPFGYK
jgi:hypothetical protein